MVLAGNLTASRSATVDSVGIMFVAIIKTAKF